MYKQSQLETHSTPTGRNGQSMAEMKPCGPRNSMCTTALNCADGPAAMLTSIS